MPFRLLSFERIPIQIHREERTRGIIRLLGGMQSGRLWGTEIAGLEERSRTRRPLSENQRAIRDRRRAVFFSLLASILVSMDIISSHRRIMPRHTRVCPRETKEEASFCFHGHHGMRASSCASLIFARAPWLSFLFFVRGKASRD